MKVDIEVTQRIVDARKYLGLSQRSIAKTLGIASTTWEGYENGKNWPGGEILSRFAGLGINIDWVFTGLGTMLRDAASQHNRPLDSMALRDSIQLVDDWLDENDREMSADKKADVVATIYEMAVEDAGSGQPKVNPTQVSRILRLVS